LGNWNNDGKRKILTCLSEVIPFIEDIEPKVLGTPHKTDEPLHKLLITVTFEASVSTQLTKY